jgi:hypothetical protein
VFICPEKGLFHIPSIKLLTHFPGAFNAGLAQSEGNRADERKGQAAFAG